MTDSEEITKLKTKIKELKKQLEENKKADELRHKEVKELQEQHHKDNLFWNKITALAMPATLLLSLIAWFMKKGKKDNSEEDPLSVKTDKTWT